MQALDTKNILNNVLFDPARKIPKAHLLKVCKLHEGEDCCRYIGLGVKGFVCVKRTKMKPVLDGLAAQNKMVAKGDCCEGLGEMEPPQTSNSPAK